MRPDTETTIAHSTYFQILATVLLGLLPPGALAEDCPFGSLNPSAPEETAQFGFLIGEWDCSIRRMGSDGQLGEAVPALWTGKYILDGWAIQDDWVSTTADGRPNHGMNIRSFDKDRRKWDNRWLSSGSLKWLYMEAEQHGDQMVMVGEQRRDSTGRTFIARNVFHDIGESSWRWRHDRSFDGGQTWLEGVSVIEARRRRGCASDGPENRQTPRHQANLTAREIPVGEMIFDALEVGPRAGELVILLHGFPQTAYSWRHQMPRLADAGYHAVAPNQRGYSSRARPTDAEAYAIGRLAEDVIGMANTLGSERFHLVGHDWGGAVAWVVATRFPDRLLTLSVLSTPHYRALSAALSNPQSSQSERSSYFARFAAEGAERGFLADNAAALKELLFIPGQAESDLEEYLRILGEPEAIRAALNWYTAMTLRTSPSPQRSGSTIPVPTLYVWGTEDSAFSREAAEATAQYVEGPYEFVTLDGIGHWLAESAPEQISELLLRQLVRSN